MTVGAQKKLLQQNADGDISFDPKLQVQRMGLKHHVTMSFDMQLKVGKAARMHQSPSSGFMWKSNPADILIHNCISNPKIIHKVLQEHHPSLSDHPPKKTSKNKKKTPEVGDFGMSNNHSNTIPIPLAVWLRIWLQLLTGHI